MKKSNFLLSIVATFAIGVAVGTSNLILTQEPTHVEYVPVEASTVIVGGGIVVDVPENPTDRQKKILGIAYTTATKDGFKFPRLLQAIILQETKAGIMNNYKVAGDSYGLKVNERYYGVSQLKLATAKDALKKYPELWREFSFQGRTDEEIIAKLIENDTFNIAVASKYVLILNSLGYNTPQKIATAYRLGATGAKFVNASKDEYSVAVMKHEKTLISKP